MTLCLPLMRDADATHAPTRRQAQVLDALADGLSVEGVARRLGMAYETVRSHVRTLAAGAPGAGSALERVRAMARRRVG